MLTEWTAELTDWLTTAATGTGFDRAGVASAPSGHETAGAETATRFTAWVDAGYAGEMNYLKRVDADGELLRRSARVAFPWVRSVVVCAFNYNAAAPRSIDPAPPGTGWIARYAWNGHDDGTPADYHDDLLQRLHVLEAGLQARAACQTKCFVDTGPLLERDFAARAGVGWIGKNTCVLNQQLGSWLLLGVILTSLPVETHALALPAEDRCGTCTRCIEACPTDALLGAQDPRVPRQMDASRCIAYLTIEHKGAIAEDLRAGMGRQVFGCDICQDVCPWNRRAPAAVKAGLATRSKLVNPDLAMLAAMDAAEFKRWFKGSPLERTRLHRLQRTVALAMGNSGLQEFAPRLREWAGGTDAVLAEAARWALGRLEDG